MAKIIPLGMTMIATNNEKQVEVENNKNAE
jgi:hypothetical protein